jgi:hypothetical protein
MLSILTFNYGLVLLTDSMVQVVNPFFTMACHCEASPTTLLVAERFVKPLKGHLDRQSQVVVQTMVRGTLVRCDYRKEED